MLLGADLTANHHLRGNFIPRISLYLREAAAADQPRSWPSLRLTDSAFHPWSQFSDPDHGSLKLDIHRIVLVAVLS